MKVYYYMGRNDRNVSGVSWKLWKIERRGRVIQVWWGRATLRRRKPFAHGRLATKTWKKDSEELAKEEERNRIAKKLAKGYERTRPRPRR